MSLILLKGFKNNVNKFKFNCSRLAKLKYVNNTFIHKNNDEIKEDISSNSSLNNKINDKENFKDNLSVEQGVIEPANNSFYDFFFSKVLGKMILAFLTLGTYFYIKRKLKQKEEILDLEVN